MLFRSEKPGGSEGDGSQNEEKPDGSEGDGKPDDSEGDKKPDGSTGDAGQGDGTGDGDTEGGLTEETITITKEAHPIRKWFSSLFK